MEEKERRSGNDQRRSGSDRRKYYDLNYTGPERRSGAERRFWTGRRIFSWGPIMAV